MRRRDLAAVMTTLLFLLSGLAAFAQTQEPEDRQKSGSAFQNLDPKLYWFYDGMGRLRDLKTTDDTVTGEFLDRQKPFGFTISRSQLQDKQARTEGYKMAAERIISYLKPGKFSDSDDTRRQLAELEKDLRRITGEKHSGYDEWKTWWDQNGSKLRWSEKEQHLVPSSK